MHHSRLCAVLIDCKTADLDKAARFWAAALGRPVDLGHPMSRDNYRMLETRSDEVLIEIQRVEHESRAKTRRERRSLATTRPQRRDHNANRVISLEGDKRRCLPHDLREPPLDRLTCPA